MPPAQKILLIDDDNMMGQLVGFMVAAFRRGSFVLEHIKDFDGGLKALLSGDYVLCLLDYHLGDRDGLQLLREAMAQQCHTPVILLTGDDNEGTDMAALDVGAADFMAKSELNPRGLERAVFYALKMAAALQQLRALAFRDELTQLLNRREFDRRLGAEWLRSVRFQRPLALMMMDLDRFKIINDTHGHPAGDAVLQHVAGLLAAQIRQVDCVARLGGDEFALLMIETDHKSALGAAARLRGLVASTPCVFAPKQLTLSVGLSAGVASWPENADSVSALVAAADAALYESKRLGRSPELATGR